MELKKLVLGEQMFSQSKNENMNFTTASICLMMRTQCSRACGEKHLRRRDQLPTGLAIYTAHKLGSILGEASPSKVYLRMTNVTIIYVHTYTTTSIAFTVI